MEATTKTKITLHPPKELPDYRHFLKGGVYATQMASRSPDDIQGQVLLTDIQDDANIKMLKDALGPGLSFSQAKAEVANGGALEQARTLVREALKTRGNADLARMLMNVASWVY